MVSTQMLNALIIKKAPYYHIRMFSEVSCVLLTPTVLKVPKLSGLLY